MKKLKILIIEDDVGLCAAYSTALGLRGYELFFSLEMDKIEKLMRKVDIILSDYNMGLDFNEIAVHAGILGVPFIAVTSEDKKVHANQLQKPFHLNDLFKKMEEVMATRN